MPDPTAIDPLEDDMSKVANAQHRRTDVVNQSAQIGVGVLLTAIAGYVNAVSYIELGGVFASFMSGSSISLAVGINEGHWSAVQQGACLIAAFLGGTTAATVITGVALVWALPATLLLEEASLPARFS